MDSLSHRSPMGRADASRPRSRGSRGRGRPRKSLWMPWPCRHNRRLAGQWRSHAMHGSEETPAAGRTVTNRPSNMCHPTCDRQRQQVCGLTCRESLPQGVHEQLLAEGGFRSLSPSSRATAELTNRVFRPELRRIKRFPRCPVVRAAGSRRGGRSMRTIKGPALFLAQFARDEPPQNTLPESPAGRGISATRRCARPH